MIALANRLLPKLALYQAELRPDAGFTSVLRHKAQSPKGPFSDLNRLARAKVPESSRKMFWRRSLPHPCARLCGGGV